MHTFSLYSGPLVSCLPEGNSLHGERSRISWAYSPKVIRTNEIARLVIITLYNSKIFTSSYLNICTFFEWVWRMFVSLLGDTVAKVCTSPRNSTWFTRLFLLVRGWGLETRLLVPYHRTDSSIGNHTSTEHFPAYDSK